MWFSNETLYIRILKASDEKEPNGIVIYKYSLMHDSVMYNEIISYAKDSRLGDL